MSNATHYYLGHGVVLVLHFSEYWIQATMSIQSLLDDRISMNGDLTSLK